MLWRHAIFLTKVRFMSADPVTILAMGDVGPVHEPVERYSAGLKAQLAAVDIRFCASERPYGRHGEVQLECGVGAKPFNPDLARCFQNAGIDVVALGSNHVLDWGQRVMLDTMHMFRKMGMQTIGVGETLEEACQPAYIERRGKRIAFIGFCSVLRQGWEASATRPGLAPLRAQTHYVNPNSYQPGFPAKIVTLPLAEDLELLRRTIRAARAQADVVAVSMHWGVPFVPRLIADYQTIAAQAAIEAGADVILGHHAHVAKAVAVYDGKPCFYSLGNFMITSNFMAGDAAAQARFERNFGVTLDPARPRLPYGSDSKYSMAAKLVVGAKGLERTSLLPIYIDTDHCPQMPYAGDPRFEETLAFIDWASEHFPHAFTVEGNEVVVS